MTVKYLSICGGGFPQTIINYGIFKYLSLKKIINYDNIEIINATSAGTLTSLLFLLNINWDILDNFVFNRPWHDIFKLSKNDIINLYTKKGLYDIEIFIKIIEPLLTYKNFTKESTLLDLYNTTNIKFNIFATKVNSLETIIFNHETFPDYKIIDCLYMSSCIPGIFSPYYDVSSNNTFIDGSLLINSPYLDILKHSKLDNNELLVIDNSIEEFNYNNLYLENNMNNYCIIYNYDVSCCYNIINDCSNYEFLDFDMSLSKTDNNDIIPIKKDITFFNFFIILIKLIIQKFNKLKFNIFYIDTNKNLKKNKNIEFLYINTYHKQNRFDYYDWKNVLEDKYFRYKLAIYGMNLCYSIVNHKKFNNNLKNKFKNNDSYILIE